MSEYKILFPSSWEKDYKKLDQVMKNRIRDTLTKIMEKPYSGKPLSGNLRGLWSLRIGKYRLIYEINEQNKEIFINGLGLRKNVYY